MLGLTRLLAALPVDVEETPLNRALAEILPLARALALSAYDACYVELALRRGLPLATADDQLARAAPNSAPSGAHDWYLRWLAAPLRVGPQWAGCLGETSVNRLFGNRESTPSEAAPALEPIRIYTRDIVVAGWVQPSDERMTDRLHRGQELAVLPEGADPSAAESWISLAASDVLMVIPPPHVSPPEKRLHRQTQQVLVRIGQYVVSGTAHLKPGFEQDLFLRATQPFLPLTDAVIAIEDGEAPYDVVIVNLAEVEEMREA